MGFIFPEARSVREFYDVSMRYLNSTTYIPMIDFSLPFSNGLLEQHRACHDITQERDYISQVHGVSVTRSLSIAMVPWLLKS